MTAFIMKSTRVTLSRMGVSVAFAALAAASFALPAAAQEARIAAVNSERILRDSQPAKAAQAKLEAEFAKRDRDLQDTAAKLKTMSDKLDKDSAVLADADRTRRQRELSDLDRDFQRKQREFREDAGPQGEREWRHTKPLLGESGFEHVHRRFAQRARGLAKRGLGELRFVSCKARSN
jgi:outer membrane protein